MVKIKSLLLQVLGSLYYYYSLHLYLAQNGCTYYVAGYQNGGTLLIFFWLLTDNLEKIDRDFWIYQIGGG